MGQLTLYLALWGAIGPLIGIIVGHLLSRSWQRRQWLMDQRIAEFRELVTALEDSLRAYLTRFLGTEAYTREEHREVYNRQASFHRIVRTRIFTANDMRILNIDERWDKAIHDYQQNSDLEIFRSVYESLMQDLVKAAAGK